MITDKKKPNAWVDELSECVGCRESAPFIEQTKGGLKQCKKCHLGYPHNPGEVYERAPEYRPPSHPHDETPLFS